MSFHIGLDPGRNNGLALYDAKTKKLISLMTLNFWEVFKKVQELSRTYKIHSVLIENPALNKPVFMSGEQKAHLQKAFEDLNRYARINEDGFKKAMDEVDSAIRIHSKKAQNVGRNKEHAHLLIDWFERNNYLIIEIRPSIPKMDHKSFCEYTGWTQRTNEHVRDAARLVYGIDPQL